MTKLCQEPERPQKGGLQPRESSRLLRTQVAARYLGLSIWKLRRLAQEGKIPVVQYADGVPWLFDLRDLDRWIDQNKQIIPL
jgi:excisionase family DNA binding protein